MPVDNINAVCTTCVIEAREKVKTNNFYMCFPGCPMSERLKNWEQEYGGSGTWNRSKIGLE